MDKVLTLKLGDEYFIDSENPIEISSFRYDAVRMGSAPTITCTIMHQQCLDDKWVLDRVYVEFSGERYYVRQMPSSSLSSEDARYKHEVTFVCERSILDNVYFYDVVSEDVENDKPVSNNTSFDFFGDIKQFVRRLNYSLNYSNIGYSAVVDEDVELEEKLISFDDYFFTDVLKNGYETYNVPYYFVGKVIHYGYSQNKFKEPFKYGIDNELLVISKNNSNQSIVNRITGTGSSDNLPYYYPNEDPKGVVEVLYNGDNQVVTIDNKQKFKSVKLSDIFNYVNTAPRRNYLTNGNQYNVTGEIVNIDDEGNYYISGIEFPFNIDSLKDTFFNIQYRSEFQGQDIVDVSLYKVSRDSDGNEISTLVERNFPLELVSRTSRLGTGEFKFVCNLTFYSPTSDINIESVVRRFIVLVYQMIPAVNGWFLNDGPVEVDLSDYGISIGDKTPVHGDIITNTQVSYIIPQPNLMPTIYRGSGGKERFYNATNKTYLNPDDIGEYYEFDNEYVLGNPKESKESFEDIKPTIKGITNANGDRIDSFIEFAYDTNDNDEFDEEGNYIHPYFFAKLRKFDGDYGFNLFEHSLESGNMTFSMTSGSCGACNFELGVDDSSQKNPVQVDEEGNLLRDSDGNVITSGVPQDRQNDTKNYEVWVALKKDIDTFGVVMPNVTNKYYPSVENKFVILNIDLPQAYIDFAENELKEELIKTMYEKNSEKFNFSIDFSRIFFEENKTTLSTLNENSQIKVEYNSKVYDLYVSSYSYSLSEGDILPEVRIELFDSVDIKWNVIDEAFSKIQELESKKANKGDSINDYGIKDVRITNGNTIKVGRTSVSTITEHQELKPLIFNVNGKDVGMYNPAQQSTIFLDSATPEEVSEIHSSLESLSKNYNEFVSTILDESSSHDNKSDSLFTKVVEKGVTYIRANYDFYTPESITFGGYKDIDPESGGVSVIDVELLDTNISELNGKYEELADRISSLEKRMTELEAKLKN